ncbi:inner centromere protein [Narcine bancroftii]|uniref:inner centromere protein n=1 Tax=Narcine bancroftii TaxID=1343680 RepID=UPI0038315ADF
MRGDCTVRRADRSLWTGRLGTAGMENLSQTEKTTHPLKDLCDYLMDAIDAQLRQMQDSISRHGHSVTGLAEGTTFQNITELSKRTDAGCAGQADFQTLSGSQQSAVTWSQSSDPRSHHDVPTDKPRRQEVAVKSRKSQYEWRVESLLGCQHMEDAAHHSDSNSVCTEDFSSRFYEAMVDPMLDFDLGSNGAFSECSQTSLSGGSKVSYSLHPEPLEKMGNEAWDSQSVPCVEKVGHDQVDRRAGGVVIPETSTRVQPSRSMAKGWRLQANADPTENFGARTCCSPTKENSRPETSQRTRKDESSVQFLAEWSSEQRNSKRDPRLKECLTRSWRWNKSPQVPNAPWLQNTLPSDPPVFCHKGPALTVKDHQVKQEKLIVEPHAVAGPIQCEAVELEKVQNALTLEYRTWSKDWEKQLQQHQLSLKEENERTIHQTKELQKEQEKEREVKRLAHKIVQTEEELTHLWSRSSEQEAQEQREQARRSLVSEVRMECERIQALIQRARERALGEIDSLPSNTQGRPSQMTLEEALRTLRRVGEDIHQLVTDLHQELETQWQESHYPRRHQEREVKQQQGECFSREEGKALAAFEDRLIQNHTEACRLQSSLVQDSRSEGGHTPQQQLLEESAESQIVQSKMAHWKDETICKLAQKFDEDFNEIEKDFLKNRSKYRQKTERLENEMHQLLSEHSESSPFQLVSTPKTSSRDIPLRQKDFGTMKLFRHLQNRVKQLQAENLIHHGTGLKPLCTVHGDMGSLHKNREKDRGEEVEE